MNDEYGGSAIAELVGPDHAQLAEPQPAPHGPLLERARRDVVADPVLGARRRRVDRRASGRWAPGVTTLPAKTAKWTTTQGKLTQDECNAAAKAFSSKAFDLRHYDDDSWVKNNPDAAADRRAGGELGRRRAAGGPARSATHVRREPRRAARRPRPLGGRSAGDAGRRPARADLGRAGRGGRAARRPGCASGTGSGPATRSRCSPPTTPPTSRRCSRSGTRAASRCRSPAACTRARRPTSSTAATPALLRDRGQPADGARGAERRGGARVLVFGGGGGRGAGGGASRCEPVGAARHRRRLDLLHLRHDRQAEGRAAQPRATSARWRPPTWPTPTRVGPARLDDPRRRPQPRLGPDGAALPRPRRGAGAAALGRLRRRRAARAWSRPAERSSFFVPPTLLRRLCRPPAGGLGVGRADRDDPRRRRAGPARRPARRRSPPRPGRLERLRPGRVALHDHRPRQGGDRAPPSRPATRTALRSVGVARVGDASCASSTTRRPRAAARRGGRGGGRRPDRDGAATSTCRRRRAETLRGGCLHTGDLGLLRRRRAA